MAYLLALLAAYVPAILWLAFFRGQDRYRPLPRILLVSLFLLGVGATVPAGWLNEAARSPSIDPGADAAWLAFLVLAALIEEITKLAFAGSRIVGSTAIVEVVDGMVALTTVALGFAAAETTQYLVNEIWATQAYQFVPGTLGATLAAVAPGRAIVSALGHVAWSGIVGYALGAWYLGRATPARVAGVLVGAAALHFLFNAFLTGGFGIGAPQTAGALAAWGASLAAYAWLFQRALAESPFRHAELLARVARSPILDGIPDDRVVVAAAHLVLRRHAAGDVVTAAGDAEIGLGIVVEGRVEADPARPGGRPRPLGPGDVFGGAEPGHGSAAPGGEPALRVVAVTGATTLVLAQTDLDELLGSDPRVRGRFARGLAAEARQRFVGGTLLRRHLAEAESVMPRP